MYVDGGHEPHRIISMLKMMILFFGGLIDKLLKLLHLYSNRLLYREKAGRERV